MGAVRGGVFGPVHGVIWRLAGSDREESPNDLGNQNAEKAIANSENSGNAANRMDAVNAENVLLFRFMVQSIDATHRFPYHHHLRAFLWGDGDRIVVRVHGEEFDAFVVPCAFGYGLFCVVFLHGEATAVFRVAHGVELGEADAALAGALRAGAEEVPGAVLDVGLHRVIADAGDKHVGFDRGPGGFGPADFLGCGLWSPQAGGGFEAANGDETSEFVVGGRSLDEAREVAVFALLVVGAGVHDSHGGGTTGCDPAWPDYRRSDPMPPSATAACGASREEHPPEPAWCRRSGRKGVRWQQQGAQG